MTSLSATEVPDIEPVNKQKGPTVKQEFTDICLNATEVLDEDPEMEEQGDITEQELKARRWNNKKKIILGTLLLGFIIFVIVDSTTTGYLRRGIGNFLKWIENNAVAGMFAFMLVYFSATVVFIPGSILTLGAGFVFAKAFGLGGGLLIAILSVFIGASLGAIVAFLLGRYLLRDWVKDLSKKYAIFEALDIGTCMVWMLYETETYTSTLVVFAITALEEKGFRIMVLLRLSPIIPFNAINYVAGVSAISLANYCMALVGILPGTTLYVFLGASAGSLADSANSGDNMTVTVIVVVVGAVFGIFAVVLTSYYAKKELNRVSAHSRIYVLSSMKANIFFGRMCPCRSSPSGKDRQMKLLMPATLKLPKWRVKVLLIRLLPQSCSSALDLS
jgi:uncharacterized membrane protein YdjX (TVP38/TMEM64 family)